ncbi:MAG: DUF2917 domain-containing protein [Burkholderiales bacterium]|nr:DUF2917 domain-containing protein [Burkholderiales bacterium]
MTNKLTSIQYVYTLRQEDVLALNLSSAHTLTAGQTRLWVTRAGDATDYWLEPGESLQLAPRRQHWVSAEASGDILIGRATPRRLGLWRQLLARARHLRRAAPQRCGAPT